MTRVSLGASSDVQPRDAVTAPPPPAIIARHYPSRIKPLSSIMINVLPNATRPNANSKVIYSGPGMRRSLHFDTEMSTSMPENLAGTYLCHISI